MKKIITVIAVCLLVGCLAIVLTGCGGDKDGMTTVPEASVTNPVTEKGTNSGKVTDESGKDDNGVIGDIVTDVSEDVSKAVTDVSEIVSDAVR